MTATPTAPPDLPERPPHPDELPRRKPLPWWDRMKFLLLLTIVWFVLVWARMADNPILPFVDAVRDAAAGRSPGCCVLSGIELLRQVHFLISEHWAAYHRFWTHRVFGGTERLLPAAALATGPGSGWRGSLKWRVLDRRARGRARRGATTPRRCWRCSRLRGDLLWPRCRSSSSSLFFWRRRASSSSRSSGSCPAAASTSTTPTTSRPGSATCGARTTCWPGCKENIVFLENPERDRGQGRLRAGRPAAVGSARHRQDADGRGGGRRDRQAVRVRRPRRVHQHVHGRRHPQGQVAVPQAAQARAALRRRDRLLRRGRLARQPRRARPGRPRRGPRA